MVLKSEQRVWQTANETQRKGKVERDGQELDLGPVERNHVELVPQTSHGAQDHHSINAICRSAYERNQGKEG